MQFQPQQLCGILVLSGAGAGRLLKSARECSLDAPEYRDGVRTLVCCAAIYVFRASVYVGRGSWVASASNYTHSWVIPT